MIGNLFSVHTTVDDAFVLHLEEHDATISLIEEVVHEVSSKDLNELRRLTSLRNLNDMDDVIALDNFRASFPSPVLRLARMTEEEALALAYMIVEQVKVKRARDQKRPPALKVVE